MPSSQAYIVFSFILGAIIGSFLNVLIYRSRTGMGIGGRSMCMSCGKTLGWSELMPILSFIIQRGRCTACRSRISWQYPAVELATAVMFALIIYRWPPSSLGDLISAAISIVIASLLVVITAYDLRHKIIPDGFVLAFDLLALVTVFWDVSRGLHPPHIWTLLAGPILALPFALLWLVSRGRWIGLGDAKLALGIGWLLGLNSGASAIILAFWIGAAVSLIWMFAIYHRYKRGIEIPFGPFLVLGTVLVWLSGAQVVDLRVLAALF